MDYINNTATTTPTPSNNTILKQADWQQFKKNTYDNFEEWGHPLTVEQYWRREEVAKEVVSGHRAWVLVDEVTNEIYASCETFANLSYYCNKDSPSELKEGYSESVASVFIERKYRGKGYSTQLMNKLRERFQQEGTRIFCDLYSDVAPKVYEKSGWEAYPVKTLKIKSEEPLKFTTPTITTTDQFYITRQNYETVLEDEMKHTRKAFELAAEKYKNDSKYQYFFAKVFGKEQLLWQSNQTEIYTTFLNITKPTNIGYRIKSEGDDQSYIIWSHDIRDCQLNVLKLSASNINDFQVLIEKASQEAKLYNLKTITIWWCENSDQRLPLEFIKSSGYDVEDRKGSIPMVVSWIPNSQNPTPQQCLWINIEKFCWV
eukprot:gene5197-6472_t